MSGVKSFIIITVLLCGVLVMMYYIQTNDTPELDDKLPSIIISALFVLIGFLLLRRGIEQVKEKRINFKASLNWSKPFDMDTHSTGVMKIIVGIIVLVFSVAILIGLLLK